MNVKEKNFGNETKQCVRFMSPNGLYEVSTDFTSLAMKTDVVEGSQTIDQDGNIKEEFKEIENQNIDENTRKNKVSFDKKVAKMKLLDFNRSKLYKMIDDNNKSKSLPTNIL